MQLHQASFIGHGTTLRAPTADGTAGQFLRTDGSKQLSFAGGDWFDQSVKQAASPTFAGLTLGSLVVFAANNATSFACLADDSTVNSTYAFTFRSDASFGYIDFRKGGVVYYDTADLGNRNVVFRAGKAAPISVMNLAAAGASVDFYVPVYILSSLTVTRTSEQQRIRYDSSNYYSTTVSSTGGVTFDAVGTGALFTFSDVVKAAGYQSSDGSAGLSQDVEVRNAAGDGTTTLTFKNGLLTAVA
jgi:hypothetical protein